MREDFERRAKPSKLREIRGLHNNCDFARRKKARSCCGRSISAMTLGTWARLQMYGRPLVVTEARQSVLHFHLRSDDHRPQDWRSLKIICAG